MPPHYALSELLIVISAMFCINALQRQRQFTAAIAIGILGLVALIGAARFGLRLSGTLGAIHPFLTQTGSTLATGLLLAAMLGALRETEFSRNIKTFVIMTAAGLTLISLWLPAITMLVLLAGGIILPILCLIPSHQPLNIKLSHGVIASLFIFGLMAVRRSPVLGPDLSFHIYHMLIAIWLVGISSAIIYASPNTPRRPLVEMFRL